LPAVKPRPLVLAYHGLARVPRALDPTGLMLPPEQFRDQVSRLRSRGYAFVNQAEFARRLGAGPAGGLCSLTFDDGSQDNLTVLLPLLRELGVAATVFVCPGLLGRPYPFLPAETGLRLMDRDQLLELARDPLVEIGSHTVDHTALADAGAEQAYREMARGKQAVEDLVGAAAASFAYPDCAYSSYCPEAAERAGYTSAVTCGDRGRLAPFELRRESPDPMDGRLAFELKTRGLYYRVRRSLPARLVRAATRPVRHRRGRSPA
jgi:peptidoglycan/xylan/chitin deacetylase (PgdA/CDA1 family)